MDRDFRGLPIIKDNRLLCWCHDADGRLIMDSPTIIEFNRCYKHRALEVGFVDWLNHAANEMEAQQEIQRIVEMDKQRAELFTVSTKQYDDLANDYYSLKAGLKELLDEHDN